MDTTKELADAPELEAPTGTSDAEIAGPPAPVDKQQSSDDEQAWSEHSATAWALAHVIHRIRSTPFPPILLPEQRRHFQHVIHMAAALMEEWQRRERDQAQQLAAARPAIGPLMDQPEMDENHSGGGSPSMKNQSDTPYLAAELAVSQSLASDLFQENQEKGATGQRGQRSK